MASKKESRSLMPNIIPMAGVALLVVLMMMMTANQLLTHENTPVEVPSANTMERKTEENLTLTLQVDPNGTRNLYLNDSLMPQPAIERAISNKMSADSYYLIVIRADRSVPSQWVMDLLALVRESGAQRIALSTKARKKPAEG